MHAQTYEITFLGQAGTTLQAEFDDCQVTVGPGTTTLRAELPDRGALSGLMERINSLALDVTDVNLVAPPVQQLPAQVTHRGDDARPSRQEHLAARMNQRFTLKRVMSCRVRGRKLTV